LQLAKEDPSRWLVLSATASTEAMLSQLLKALKERKWLA
jgi:hypothetical protein